MYSRSALVSRFRPLRTVLTAIFRLLSSIALHSMFPETAKTDVTAVQPTPGDGPGEGILTGLPARKPAGSSAAKSLRLLTARASGSSSTSLSASVLARAGTELSARLWSRPSARLGPKPGPRPSPTPLARVTGSPSSRVSGSTLGWMTGWWLTRTCPHWPAMRPRSRPSRAADPPQSPPAPSRQSS
jgi:hypothetical protein